MGFVIRRETLLEILSDPWWSKELDAAKTTDQAREVVEAYCREKGLKVKHMELGGKKDEAK